MRKLKEEEKEKRTVPLAGDGSGAGQAQLGLRGGGLRRHDVRPGSLWRAATCFGQGRDLSDSCHHG